MTIVFSKYDPTLTYAGQKKFDCGNAAGETCMGLKACLDVCTVCQ